SRPRGACISPGSTPRSRMPGSRARSSPGCARRARSTIARTDLPTKNKERPMHGLTSLGVIHTIISLIAVGAAIIALARDHQLVADNRVGRVYMVATVLTCLTGLPIFQHGGFGPPHAL